MRRGLRALRRLRRARPQMPQEQPRTAHRGPRVSPGPPTEGPGAAQDRPQRAQGSPRTAYRGPRSNLGPPTKAPGIAQDCPQRPQEQPRTAYKWSRSGPRLPTEGLTTSHPSIRRQISRKNTLTNMLPFNLGPDYLTTAPLNCVALKRQDNSSIYMCIYLKATPLPPAPK